MAHGFDIDSFQTGHRPFHCLHTGSWVEGDCENCFLPMGSMLIYQRVDVMAHVDLVVVSIFWCPLILKMYIFPIKNGGYSINAM